MRTQFALQRLLLLDFQHEWAGLITGRPDWADDSETRSAVLHLARQTAIRTRELIEAET